MLSNVLLKLIACNLIILKTSSSTKYTYDGEYCKIHTRDGKIYTGTVLSLSPSVHVYKDSRTLERSEATMYVRIDEVVKTKKDVEDFMNLKQRLTGEEINLTNKGIVITEKLAKTFGINPGDKVKVGDEINSKEVKVIGIAENYLYNYIYFTPKLYEEIFEEQIKYNQFFVNTDDLELEEMEDVVDTLKENDKISGVVLTANLNNEYQKSLTSLTSIVLLCIGCASLLAFIVLINLNIINIAERKRELATLKLLGFYDKEVSSYVFRENVILTILGILVGMLLGNFVLGIIIQSAEVETIMLPNELSVQSLGYAAILTLVFTFVTNFVMNPKIKKIDMTTKVVKRRSVVSFANLPEELQEGVKKLYPYGYNEAMMRIEKPNGDFFYAVPFETEEVSYLVKVAVKIDDHIEDEEDKDYYSDDLKGADEFADNEEDEDIDNLRDEI